jgi:hypothetical protein
VLILGAGKRRIIIYIIVGIFLMSAITTIGDPTEGPPIPGDMDSDELDLIADYYIDFPIVHHEISLSNDDEILSLIQQIDESLYLGYLQDLVDFGPRVTATQVCENSGDYIYNKFIEMGLSARKQYWESDDLYGHNIEAAIEGVDETSDEIYIICAHYDSVSGSPGADDDGSGTVAVMAAAKVMSQYDFNHTIKFVTFPGEEQGLYGSYFYAQEAVDNNDNIVAVLNADMIGFTGEEGPDTVIRIFEDEYSEWITDFTTDVSEEYENEIGIEVIPSGYTWRSDHYRFWEVGYQAIFYHEYEFNQYYHSPDDIIENMNIDYATRSTRLMVATLAELAQLYIQKAPDKPSTPTGPPSGKTGEEYTYYSVTTDPQGEQIEYLFDWGDGSDSGWVGPYNSGEEGSASHIWTTKDNYEIKVKARDSLGHESPWSEPLPIAMVKNTNQQDQLLIRILNLLIDTFPVLESLLGPILNNLVNQ